MGSAAFGAPSASLLGNGRWQSMSPPSAMPVAHTPNPTYRRGLLRHDGPQRGRARRLRSQDRQLRDAAEDVLGGHDPTQGMRQGNDVGTQYRSGIYVDLDAQRKAAKPRNGLPAALLGRRHGYGPITTEIIDAPEFYFAEDYHQQYLAKNPARLLRSRRHRCLAARWCRREGGSLASFRHVLSLDCLILSLRGTIVDLAPSRRDIAQSRDGGDQDLRGVRAWSSRMTWPGPRLPRRGRGGAGFARDGIALASLQHGAEQRCSSRDGFGCVLGENQAHAFERFGA